MPIRETDLDHIHTDATIRPMAGLRNNGPDGYPPFARREATANALHQNRDCSEPLRRPKESGENDLTQEDGE
jgi:hypothetical protein